MEKFEQLSRKELFGITSDVEVKQSGNAWLYVLAGTILVIGGVIVYNRYKREREPKSGS